MSVRRSGIPSSQRALSPRYGVSNPIDGKSPSKRTVSPSITQITTDRGGCHVALLRVASTPPVFHALNAEVASKPITPAAQRRERAKYTAVLIGRAEMEGHWT